MPFSDTSFDRETKAVAARALADACQELSGDADPIDHATWTMAKVRILAGLVDGERDPEKLKVLALQALR